jgi:nitrate reductase gamma subunit
VFILGTVERYRRHAYSCSSHSSQFLENRQHFWSSVPFHYGILVVLLGHLVAFAVPRQVLAWNAVPLRLFVLEATGLMFGLLALVGFAAVVVRRASEPKVRATTGRFDWVVYALLFVQLASGVEVALSYAWGSTWFAAGAAPYLGSLVLFQPDIAFVSVLPFAAKLHIVAAFVLAVVFPFSRLVHILNVPTPYLWRRPQVVRWQRPRPSPAEE